MATFVPGRPITTDQPFIDVDAGLAIGTHRFQLVVVDEQGNRSLPDVHTVTVFRLTIPTPIGPIGPVVPISLVTPIEPVRPIGTIAPAPARPVRGRKGSAQSPDPARSRKGGQS